MSTLQANVNDFFLSEVDLIKLISILFIFNNFLVFRYSNLDTCRMMRDILLPLSIWWHLPERQLSAKHFLQRKDGHVVHHLYYELRSKAAACLMSAVVDLYCME